MAANTSIYLTEEDKEMLGEMMAEMGLSRSAVFRMAVRQLYEHGALDENKRRVRLLQIADDIRSIA